MWNKPNQIAGYKGKGYENWAWRSNGETPKVALGQWKRSRNHNAMITNSGMWKNTNFKGMGASINGTHACLWFGD